MWPEDEGKPWEFVGIFDSKEKAEGACLTHMFFVGPARINETTPREPTPWVGCYYPLAPQESNQ
jgi:hypothetical protein